MFKISARNQLPGTVAAVREGAVNGVVILRLVGDNLIKADITMEDIRELGIHEGMPATAIIKATDVIVAGGNARMPMSARNQYAGTVTSVQRGAVNGHVTIKTPDGLTFTSSITNEAIEELGLEIEAPAMAVIKSTNVLVVVDE